MSQPDFYAVLGVDRGATDEQIRRAYREGARKYHPDVNKDAGAATRFRQATEAYEVLSDPKKRQAYDRFGRAGVGASTGAWSQGQWAGRGGFDPTTAGTADFGDFFEQVFAAKGAPFGTRATRRRRGEDLRHELTVSFMTAAIGGTEQLRNTSGQGPERLEVRIPAGIEDGAKLRLKGRGRPDPQGGPPGDQLVTVRIGQHPLFRREGLDVLVDVPINLAEAGLGTTVTVPLLDGTVDLKVPPGASSGQKLRIRERGIRDGKGRTGDFYAVIRIVAPERISERGRRLLEELADELQNPRDGRPWADNGDTSGGQRPPGP